jgi:alkylhydroperoxidase family enzyme
MSRRSDAMNKPAKLSQRVLSIVLAVLAAASAVPVHAEGPVARVPDVDDATFADLQKFFDAQEIVEITVTVDTYVGTALFTRALRIKIEDDGRLTAIGKC